MAGLLKRPSWGKGGGKMEDGGTRGAAGGGNGDDEGVEDSDDNDGDDELGVEVCNFNLLLVSFSVISISPTNTNLFSLFPPSLFHRLPSLSPPLPQNTHIHYQLNHSLP